MKADLRVLREHFRRMDAAYLVLIISLTPTLIAYRRVKQNVADRDEYFPMIYLSAAGNSPNWAPGWDLFNEPVRRNAMERARQADRPIATGKVTLLTPDGPKPEPGFALYLPVYRNAVKPKNG